MSGLASLKERVAALASKPRHTKTGGIFVRGGVPKSAELTRIFDLPRRQWRDYDLRELNDLLRRPGGTMELRPIQAAALHEMWLCRGLLAPVVVGGGKTLITYLAPLCMDAERALLVVPAALRDKTRREFDTLSKHWDGTPPEIMSYELLGRDRGKLELEALNPDLVLADECHRLKNPKAACTKRMRRHMVEHPETVFVGMSGTITSRSLRDFAHLLEWSLGERSPLPRTYNVLLDWCAAVDEKVGTRIQPGALREMFDQDEKVERDTTSAARRAVRRRIVETPGVVASGDEQLGASLQISEVTVDHAAVDTEYVEMRSNWVRPDGEEIIDPMQLARHCRELGLGFYYRWDPEAPREWKHARSQWAKACRHIVETNRRQLDSELPVRRAVRAGEYDGVRLIRDGFELNDGPVDEVLSRWDALKPTFEPNTVPVWLDYVALERARLWMNKHNGIVWVRDRAFGERLAAETGAPLFAAKGRDGRGRPIEDARPRDGSIIAAIKSNAAGRNLQAWNQSLVVGAPSSGLTWEQMLGRTHREGQEADEVSYAVLITCLEDIKAMEQATADAAYIQSGQQIQKLCYADLLLPSMGSGSFTGPRWGL